MTTRILSEVCEVVQGGRLKLSGSDFVPAGYPAYGAGGLNGRLPIYEFDRPAVILSSIGARCGKCFLADGKWASLANTQLIFPHADKVDPHFLWYQLNDEDRWPRSGTAQPFIKPSDVKRHEIHLPPLDEQRRIAAILDQADELRQKRREAKALAERIAAELFWEMFGDPLTPSASQPRKQIATLGVVTTGATPPSSSDGMFDGPIPFVTPGDLDRDGPVRRTLTEAGANSVRTVRAGATLVCCIGAIGKMGISKVRSAFNQQINAVEWGDEVNDIYGLSVLQLYREKIAGWGTSTTVPILNKSSFQKIEIPVPKISEQREFALAVSRLDDLKVAMRLQEFSSDSLFSSLRHRAFNGIL